MTQIPSARHSTSYYQGHGVDEPQALRTAIANSLPSQSSNPRGRLTFDGSQRPGGNGAGTQAAGTALPAGHPILTQWPVLPPLTRMIQGRNTLTWNLKREMTLEDSTFGESKFLL